MAECIICSEVYKDPRSLPCGHTYCLGCLQFWQRTCAKTENADRERDERTRQVIVQSAPPTVGPNFGITSGLAGMGGRNAMSFTCPECRSVHSIPPGGLDGFARNYAIIRAMDQLPSYDETLSLPQAGSRKEQQVAPPIDPELYDPCQRHYGNPLGFHCADCKTVVCLAGIGEEHRFHSTNRLTDVTDRIRGDMGTYMEQSGKKTTELEDFQTSVTKTVVEKGENTKQLEMQILSRKQKIIEDVETAAKKLLDKLEGDEHVFSEMVQCASNEADLERLHIRELQDEIRACLQVDKLNVVYTTYNALKPKMASSIKQSLDLVKPSARLFTFTEPNLDVGELVGNLREKLVEPQKVNQNTQESSTNKKQSARPKTMAPGRSRVVADQRDVNRRRAISSSDEASEKPQKIEWVRTINVRVDKEKRNCILGDVTFMDDEYLAVADWYWHGEGNGKVKVFDLEGRLLSKTKFGTKDGNIYICTLPWERRHLVISHGALNTVSRWDVLRAKGGVSNFLPTSPDTSIVGIPNGVTVSYRREGAAVIVATQNPVGLWQATPSGQLTSWALQRPYPRCIAGHPAHTTVAVNHGMSSVAAYKEGRLMWEAPANLLSRPSGLAMTGEGNTIITDMGSEQVLLMSARGRLKSVLLSYDMYDEVGVCQPAGVAYSARHSLLAVTEFKTGQIKLYRYKS